MVLRRRCCCCLSGYRCSYVANNAIDSLRELQKLKQLSKLIILDLVGNAASSNSDPEEYVVRAFECWVSSVVNRSIVLAATTQARAE